MNFIKDKSPCSKMCAFNGIKLLHCQNSNDNKARWLQTIIGHGNNSDVNKMKSHTTKMENVFILYVLLTLTVTKKSSYYVSFQRILNNLSLEYGSQFSLFTLCSFWNGDAELCQSTALQRGRWTHILSLGCAPVTPWTLL